jgi:hypothetical protein
MRSDQGSGRRQTFSVIALLPVMINRRTIFMARREA